MALKNQFNLPSEFYIKAIDKLGKNFKQLENQRDVAIAARIVHDLKETIPRGYLEKSIRFVGLTPLAARYPTQPGRPEFILKQPQTIDDIINELWFLF
jgi:hypothetical protein